MVTPKAAAIERPLFKLCRKTESFAPKLEADKDEKAASALVQRKNGHNRTNRAQEINAAEAIAPCNGSTCGAEAAKEHESALYIPPFRRARWASVVSSKDSRKQGERDCKPDNEGKTEAEKLMVSAAIWRCVHEAGLILYRMPC
jgi:hypothetical protein